MFAILLCALSVTCKIACSSGSEVLLGSGSEVLLGTCYKKKFISRSVSMCEAGPHGCFETERGGDIKMGCLTNPCKPLDNFLVKHQCCNTSLCNNLLIKESFYRPTLPPLFPEVKDWGIACFSPAHRIGVCISQYGCYTLFESWEIIDQTCIESSDFRFCLQPNRPFDGRYAECCYGSHFCNLTPRGIVATVSEETPTTQTEDTNTNSRNCSQLDLVCLGWFYLFLLHTLLPWLVC